MPSDHRKSPSFAFAISVNGSVKTLTELPISGESYGAAFVWTHIHARQEGAKEWLLEEAKLDSTIVEAMLAEESRPRAVIKDNGAMVILRAINLHEGEAPEEMISLRIWIDTHRAISTQLRDIEDIREIQVSIERGESPTSPIELLKSITSRIFARIEPFLEELEDDIAAVEEQVASGADLDLCDRMYPSRRQVAVFRRHISPQKAVLQKLHEYPSSCMCEADQQHFGEELDRVTRYVEELDELAARTQILTEEVRNIHAVKLNSLAYVFSIVATIFLPLGFLTGLLGVNVGGIPGDDSSYAFWIFTAVCVGLVGIQVVIFRRLKWF